MANPEDALGDGDALVVVDVQNDFCPGGALPIERGDTVVAPLNHWIAAALARGLPVCASRDWHPAGHMSFQERGGQWPPHCIQDTQGAAFRADLDLPRDAVLVTKGVRFDQDQYSAFDQTGLAGELRERGVKRLWVGGLAQDVCVLATVLDARKEGFDVIVIADATLPVTEEGGREAERRMRDAGAEMESTGTG